MMRIQRQRLEWILALSVEIDDKIGMHGAGGTLKQSQVMKKRFRSCYVNIFALI